jgi:NitT/TauT family transport system substrate-binding protein
MKLNALFVSLCLLTVANSNAAEITAIRVGVQASGTAEWELATIKDNPQTDFLVEIHPVANAEAGKIALQSGAVDMVISDWIWVSRLRSTGSDFTFYPYSSTSGALVVAKDSPIHSINDLKNKRLGIAGGELDKNWLLLQALAQQGHLDLNTSVEKIFAAPPLINEQIKQGRVDAVLTYWHYAVRLEAMEYREIIDGKGILKGLGIQEDVPTLGYVFKQSWANAHKEALNHFLNASKQAKNQLCNLDATWQKIIPLTKVDDLASQLPLRKRYCEGKIKHWGLAEQRAADRIYNMLRTLSHNQLTGRSESLQPGTFWAAE